MNIPTPPIPTDNLYKFLAIFGLILFIFSIIINTSFITDNGNRQYQLLIEQRKNENQIMKDDYSYKTIDYDIKMSDYLYDSINTLLSKDVKITESELRTVFDMQKRIYDLKKNIDNKFYNESENAINKTLKKQQYDYEYQKVVEQMKVLYSFSYICFVVGFILSYIGFYSWYKNYQIYSDIKAKQDAGITNIDIALSYKQAMKQFNFLMAVVFSILLGTAMNKWNTSDYFTYGTILAVIIYTQTRKQQ